MSHTNSVNGHIVDKAEPYTREEYDNYLTKIDNHSGNGFMKVRRMHLHYIKDSDASLLLSHVLNKISMDDRKPRSRKELRKNGMWIRIPAKEVTAAIALSKYEKEKAIEKLVKKGIIETKHYIQNILWVRVLPEGLEAMEKAERKRMNKKEQNSQQISSLHEISTSRSLESEQREVQDLSIPSTKNSPKKVSKSPSDRDSASPSSLKEDVFISFGEPSQTEHSRKNGTDVSSTKKIENQFLYGIVDRILDYARRRNRKTIRISDVERGKWFGILRKLMDSLDDDLNHKTSRIEAVMTFLESDLASGRNEWNGNIEHASHFSRSFSHIEKWMEGGKKKAKAKKDSNRITEDNMP